MSNAGIVSFELFASPLLPFGDTDTDTAGSGTNGESLPFLKTSGLKFIHKVYTQNLYDDFPIGRDQSEWSNARNVHAGRSKL